MTIEPHHQLEYVKALRWLARVMGSLFFLIFSALFFADGLLIFLFATDPFHMTALSLALIGFLIGWKSDRFAAGFILLGTFADWVIFSVKFDGIQPNMGPLVSFFPTIGLIYLYCWWRSRKTIPD